MNTKASVITETLVFLIVITLTSAIILFLIQSGIIAVKADNNDISVLNTEFIPFAQEGTLVLKDFQFCSFVDEKFKCVGEKEDFNLGEEVHFRFVVESSTVNGKVTLVENYRVKGPQGNIILEANHEDNDNIEEKSSSEKKIIPFKEFLISEKGDEAGTYTVDLIIESPLINKKVTVVKKFTLHHE